MLLQDQQQLAQGSEIANVTMTNSIVTSYKQGGRPTVQSDSSRFSTGGDQNGSPKSKNSGVFIEWTLVETQLFEIHNRNFCNAWILCMPFTTNNGSVMEKC